MSKLTYRIKKKELREILTETKKYDKGAYQVVVLGISTGLRASDLINLKYSDLYAFDGTPHKYIYFKEQKTKKNLRIPVRMDLIKTFIYSPEKFDYYLLHKKTDPTKKLHRMTIYKRLEKYSISAHSLRKTFGYDLYKFALRQNATAAAVAMETLMSLYNHTNTAVTLRYIGHEQEKKDELFCAVSYL